MQRFFHLLYEYRAFAVFVSLELASLALTAVGDRGPQRIVGYVYAFIDDARAYATLREANVRLQHENACLQQRLLRVTEHVPIPPAPEVPAQYALVPAQVVNNSIAHTKNYLTLNKGTLHGLAPGMGVLGPEGVVGKVKAVSAHFATVVPLLHTDVLVSAKLAQSGVMGTVQWPGHDPASAQLLYVPRHVTVVPGEAVVTSGYNATFFEGVLIGHVRHASLRTEAPFYDVELRISTDFSALRHVYVVKNGLQQEKYTLEEHTRSCYE